jgi:hypothetical protein
MDFTEEHGFFEPFLRFMQKPRRLLFRITAIPKEPKYLHGSPQNDCVMMADENINLLAEVHGYG